MFQILWFRVLPWPPRRSPGARLRMAPLTGGSKPTDIRESREPSEEALRCGTVAAGDPRACADRGGGPPVTALAAATAVAAALSSLRRWACADQSSKEHILCGHLL